MGCALLMPPEVANKERTEALEFAESFWDNIMDEHARFIAHLLDPDEVELVERATKTGGGEGHRSRPDQEHHRPTARRSRAQGGAQVRR